TIAASRAPFSLSRRANPARAYTMHQKDVAAALPLFDMRGARRRSVTKARAAANRRHSHGPDREESPTIRNSTPRIAFNATVATTKMSTFQGFARRAR